MPARLLQLAVTSDLPYNFLQPLGSVNKGEATAQYSLKRHLETN